MAVRWRFGGGSGATRWRLVTGRRRPALQIAMEVGAPRNGSPGASLRVAGRLATGRRAPCCGAPYGARSAHGAPTNRHRGAPSENRHTDRHWRRGDPQTGRLADRQLWGAPCCAKYAPLHGSPLRSPLVTTCDSALTPLITQHESPRALVTAARMKENR